MANEDGSVWVTYNGEIYNFQELRTELIDRGHRFRSRTDTEVLVHGYEEWDLEGLFARLRGMFAFGLWDQRRRRLFLARDRLGEKPLYYAWQSGTLLFASELKALLASGLIERRLNPAAVVAYLTLGSVPAPLTMIEGVQALPPGCFLTLQDRRLDLERYWQLAFEEDPDLTEGEALEEVRALLKEAVRLRLVADVPVGAFLSGGVDSSAIVALMREATGGMLRTFSMVFEEQEFSEGRFARRVAQEFGIEHTEYVVTPEEVLRELSRIIEPMDQSSIDGVAPLVGADELLAVAAVEVEA
jgi:asparagine synthase (glutamine-hydrolysing)